MKKKLKPVWDCKRLQAPKWMSESAKAEYLRVLPLLLSRQTFTDADMSTLEAYCVAYGVMRDSQNAVNQKAWSVCKPMAADA